jgi:2-polyprenyl-6-methoxyphenol hydroxylase-like FAD-dependent oxidoreductase
VTLAKSGAVEDALDLPQLLTSWSRLHALLKAAFPAERYHLAKALVRVEERTGGVTACFDDGTETSADLLVAADGIRSAVRAQFLPDVKQQYAGYVAWRGLVAERTLSQGMRDTLFERFGFCLPAGEQMLGYPVAGPDNEVARGQRSYNFVWYRPADERADLPALLTDASGRVHDMSIPPQLLRAELVAAMRAEAEAKLAPQFAELVRKTAQPILQPIFDLESPRLVFGRVAVLGDAAFVARPHCGMGVTKAAEDAVVLVDALGAHATLDDALADYEQKRLRFGREVVEHARNLGAYMQAQVKSPAEQAMAERYRTTEAVMAETAVTRSFGE